jgi:glycosyltransferase involved in cell wall biosynthesis
MQPAADRSPPRIAIILKGYPRLTETFIAQEIAGLEARGLQGLLISLRHPTDHAIHPVHERVRSPCSYLPEYLYQQPLRVLRGWWQARRLPGYRAARAAWLRDLRRDPTTNRGRRFGQALVLASELPASIRWLHVHFLHTPASVVRYTALMRGLPWSGSAHAKDIWTTPDWEVREKLAACRWLVTCTASGLGRLASLAPDGERVALLYHGLDLAHLPASVAHQFVRDGSNPNDPIRILSVGRRVAKKGLDDLLQALAQLPASLHWQLEHVGGGPLGDSLKTLAASLGIADRVQWRGAQPQPEVFAAYRRADLFVLASKIAADGDRDGLPNVLLEAAHQELACVSTAVAAIPELIEDGVSGLLVPPRDPRALAEAMLRLIGDPALRRRLAAQARSAVLSRFSFEAGIDRLAEKLGLQTDRQQAAAE